MGSAKYRIEDAAICGSGGRRSGNRNWGVAKAENRQDDADGELIGVGSAGQIVGD